MRPERDDFDELDELDKSPDALVRYSDLSRRDVRSLIFHFLYAAESCEYKTSMESLLHSFNSEFHLEIPMDSDAYTIAEAVITHRAELDTLYEKLLTNWRPDRVSICTRLILRLGVWELLHTDTDSRIIINEAIELAKCFAEADAYRFVNGLLDRVIKEGVIPGRVAQDIEEEIDEEEE